MNKKYLITGESKIGKTTAIKNIVTSLGAEFCTGYYAEEILIHQSRVGFRLVTLDGKSEVIAHINHESHFRVGRYGINLNGLEKISIASIITAIQSKKIIVIDEIGPMQVYSNPLKQTIMEAINSPLPVLGTIALLSEPWLDSIKQHHNIELHQLTTENRSEVVEKLACMLKAGFSR